MKKFFNKVIPFLIFSIFTLACLKKSCDNDLFFDLKTGEGILKYGIDFKDHFSFIPNLLYMYPHWLYDILVYSVFDKGGYCGLMLLFFLFYLLFACVFYKFTKKYTNNSIVSVFATIYVILTCCTFFTTRVQSLTYLLLLLEYYFLEELYSTGKKKYMVGILLTQILIVNVHMPIWIFSVILCLPYVAECICSVLKEKFKFFKKTFVDDKFDENNGNKKIFLICALLMILTGLISPLKLYPYTYFMKSASSYNIKQIYEMQSIILIEQKTFLRLVIVSVTLLYFKILKFKIRDYCMFIGMFIFSLMAVRNISFGFFFLVLIVLKCLDKKYYIYINEKITKFCTKINYKIITSMLLIITLIGNYIVITYSFNNQFNYSIDNDLYPVYSTEYIKENIDYKNSKIYVNYGYGSYLVFNDIPVFIDSRAEVYDANFNNSDDILADYLALSDYSKYKSILKKYEFDYLLVKKDEKLYLYLENEVNFKKIYYDDNYVIFKSVKNTFDYK